MKLHIECLQEKMDNLQKEMDALKQTSDANQSLKDQFEKQMVILQDHKLHQEKEMEAKNERLKKLEQAKESLLVEMKAESTKNNQIIQVLEAKLERAIDENQQLI